MGNLSFNMMNSNIHTIRQRKRFELINKMIQMDLSDFVVASFLQGWTTTMFIIMSACGFTLWGQASRKKIRDQIKVNEKIFATMTSNPWDFCDNITTDIWNVNRIPTNAKTETSNRIYMYEEKKNFVNPISEFWLSIPFSFSLCVCVCGIYCITKDTRNPDPRLLATANIKI